MKFKVGDKVKLLPSQRHTPRECEIVGIGTIEEAEAGHDYNGEQIYRVKWKSSYGLPTESVIDFAYTWEDYLEFDLTN